MQKRGSSPLRAKRTSGFLRSLRHNRYFWLAGGLFGGVLVAGILALVLNFVIQPLSSPETWGYKTVKTSDFTVWFAENSPSFEHRNRILADLNTEFADLLGTLQVEREALELPIDVFIHDSVPAMQMSIARRKSATASTYFFSVLDVLAGNPVRPALVEVLLSQGWGHCYSQAIYLGTVLYFSSPRPEHLYTVAAAPPELRHSLDELIEMDDGAQYPPTAYQLFGDPSSPRALLSLEDWHTLWFVSDTLSSFDASNFLKTEITSVIQYIVETSGDVTPLKEAWGPGTASSILDCCWPAGTEDLAASWAHHVETPSLAEKAREAVRANLLFEAGHLEAAAAMVAAWTPSSSQPRDEILLAIRCCLSVGEFGQAADWAALLEEGQDQEILELTSGFADWRTVRSPEMVILAPASIPQDDLQQAILEPYLALCECTASDVPMGLRPTVFVHPDAASKKAASEFLDLDRDLTSIAHVSPAEDWGYEITHALLPRLWGPGPRSPLTRVGIASFLSCPYADLERHGAELSCGSGWIPLVLLDVGAAKEQVVRTESGLLFAYIEHSMGIDAVRRVWSESQETGCVTLESALRNILGTSKAEIESVLREEVLPCGELDSSGVESS